MTKGRRPSAGSGAGAPPSPPPSPPTVAPSSGAAPAAPGPPARESTHEGREQPKSPSSGGPPQHAANEPGPGSLPGAGHDDHVAPGQAKQADEAKRPQPRPEPPAHAQGPPPTPAPPAKGAPPKASKAPGDAGGGKGPLKAVAASALPLGALATPAIALVGITPDFHLAPASELVRTRPGRRGTRVPRRPLPRSPSAGTRSPRSSYHPMIASNGDTRDALHVPPARVHAYGKFLWSGDEKLS